MRRPARRRGVALLFLAPWLVGVLLFVAYPLAFSLYTSFTRYDVASAPHWIGLENYRYLFFHDPAARKAAANTLWLVVFGLPVQLGVAMATALVLLKPRRGIGIYRAIVYLPSMVPAVAATLAFILLLRPGNGVDRVLGGVGLGHPLWFFDPRFAKPALLLLSLWGIGPMVVVYLAGLLTIPTVLYEIALVEGAGRWHRFRHVTLPAMRPVITFTVVVGLIGALQFFTQAYVAGQTVGGGREQNYGQPQQSTLFYAVWLYKVGFGDLRMGYASAMAWVLLVVSLACAAVVLRRARRTGALTVSP